MLVVTTNIINAKLSSLKKESNGDLFWALSLTVLLCLWVILNFEYCRNVTCLNGLFNEFWKVEVRSKVKTILILVQRSGVGEGRGGGCKNGKWLQPAEVIMRSSNNCDTLQHPFSCVFKQHCFHGHLNSVIINWQRSKITKNKKGGCRQFQYFMFFFWARHTLVYY